MCFCSNESWRVRATPVLKQVEEEKPFVEALGSQEWGGIIIDYRPPRFGGLEDLSTVRETGQDIPFLIVCRAIGEPLGVDRMKARAHDHFLKDNLDRLVPAVKREVREAWERRQRRRTETALREIEQCHMLHTGVGMDEETSKRIADPFFTAKGVEEGTGL